MRVMMIAFIAMVFMEERILMHMFWVSPRMVVMGVMLTLMAEILRETMHSSGMGVCWIVIVTNRVLGIVMQV